MLDVKKTWADVQRAALHDPLLQACTVLDARHGREPALIATILALSAEHQRMARRLVRVLEGARSHEEYQRVSEIIAVED